MPDVTGHVADNWINNANGDWGTCRGAAGGTLTDANADATSSTFGIYTTKSTGRGGNYIIRRSYFPFDLSGYSGTASSANLKVYMQRTDSLSQSGGIVNVNLNKVIPVKCSTVIPISTDGSDNENYFGNVDFNTDYATAVQIPTSLTENSFSMNSDALTDINSAVGSGIFTLAIVTYVDYDNQDPASGVSGALKHTVYYSDHSTNKPILEVEGISAGYTKSVSGSDDPVKIIGIAATGIEKVIDV